MLEMEYQEKLEPNLLLADGYYKGYKYYILSLGTHPTAYVEVPRGHPLWFKDCDVCNEFISCHWGLTYSENYLRQCNTGEWTIGWDYAHLGDMYYSTFMPEFNRGRMWKTKEIFREVKNVINQLIIVDLVVEYIALKKLLEEVQ